LDILTGNSSRAGDGMAVGGLNGTSSNPSSSDTSTNNLENAADGMAAGTNGEEKSMIVF
jgi:hypothetical protein